MASITQTFSSSSPRLIRRRTVRLGAVSAAPPPYDPKAFVGRVLRERWRVEELAWTTPQSSLYWATHRAGTRAAIWVLAPELSADPKRSARFVQTALAVQRVAHDGAVRILDDDTDADGTVFLVVELFDATSLAWMLEQGAGPFEIDEAVHIADGMLDVLAAAHAKGVHHGALRAEDVFLTRQGQVKILGFGGGEERTPNLRHDTAATGALLYKMLVGAPPCGEPLLVHAPRVPAAVAEVVDRALGVGKGEPWADAGAMHTALSAALRAGAPRALTPAPSSSEQMNPLFLGPALRARRALMSGRFAARAAGLPKRHAAWPIALFVVLALALVAAAGVNSSFVPWGSPAAVPAP